MNISSVTSQRHFTMKTGVTAIELESKMQAKAKQCLVFAQTVYIMPKVKLERHSPNYYALALAV